jgi:hypothetical protein
MRILNTAPPLYPKSIHVSTCVARQRARVRGRADDATVSRAVMYFHSISCRRAQVRDFRPPRAHARPPRGARARAFCARACLALCGLCVCYGPTGRGTRTGHASGTRNMSVCYGSTGTADAHRHACGDAQTTQQCHALSCVIFTAYHVCVLRADGTRHAVCYGPTGRVCSLRLPSVVECRLSPVPAAFVPVPCAACVRVPRF